MDQASGLRDLMQRVPFSGYRAETGTPTVVVGSGKGGVGKSVVAALLAAAAARRGRRVLLVDGDYNLGDLHVLLGAQVPVSIDDVLEGTAAVDDIVVPVTEGLWLSPGAVGSERMYAAGPMDRARLFHRVAQSFDDYDLVVVDGGAGIDDVVRACTVAATHLVLVTVPEPAALADAFGLAKLVHSTVRGLPIDLLVNRVTDAREGSTVLAKLHAAGQRFLKRDFGVLGVLPDDALIQSAIRGARPLLEVAPGSTMASVLDELLETRHAQLGFPSVTPETSQGAES